MCVGIRNWQWRWAQVYVDSLNANPIKSVRLGLLSPDLIRGPRDPVEREKLEFQAPKYWLSWGEVTTPDTIGYRSGKPEPGGLFCQRIFGPVKDWECECGKWSSIRYRGVICDRCGTEVAHSRVRRQRMGHIELAVPVAHIWFLRSPRRVLSRILGLSQGDLEAIICYSRDVVVAPGRQAAEVGQVVDENERESLLRVAKRSGDDELVIDTGASAIRRLLERTNLGELAGRLQRSMQVGNYREQKAARRRLDVIEPLLASGGDGEPPVDPASMILEVLPVLPPGLRPVIRRPDGRFLSGDLNVLYRRVMNRNLRVERLLAMHAPEVIRRNAKRLLQEAVDELLANGMLSRKAMSTSGRRSLCSLTDTLVGKNGRFRRSLLGKRVDYSGRAVIVPGPHLSLNECGLPRAMAAELFKPFIIHRLVEREIVSTGPAARRLVEDWINGRRSTVFDRPRRTDKEPENASPPPVTRMSTAHVAEALEDVVREHPVLLNRAPTLDRLGIRAFQPVLSDHKAIALSPLACEGFAADFDGDLIGVHVPLSPEAQIESSVLLGAANNLFHPGDGRPAVIPGKEMALGWYLLTKLHPGVPEPAGQDLPEWKGARRFGTTREVEHALALGLVRSGTPIYFATGRAGANPRWLPTTPGRVLFNGIFPTRVIDATGFVDRAVDRDLLAELVATSYEVCGMRPTLRLLERLKEQGYQWATSFGVSLGIYDFKGPEDRVVVRHAAEAMVRRLDHAAAEGRLTRRSRYYLHLDIWKRAGKLLTDSFLSTKRVPGTDNGLVEILNAGAGLSPQELQHLIGLRGVMPRPRARLVGELGEALPTPVKSSLSEGLSPIEFLLSARGRRKGLVDVALQVSRAGYLMRRLVSVVHGVVITQADCGSAEGVPVTQKHRDSDGDPRGPEIVGRVSLHDLPAPNGGTQGRPLVRAGQVIDRATAEHLGREGVTSIAVRSPLTCYAPGGCCQACYGWGVGDQELASIGDAVGIRAAQAIGECCVQQALNSRREAGVRELPGWVEARAVAGGVVGYSSAVDIAALPVVREGRRSTIRVAVGTRPGSKSSDRLEMTVESADGNHQMVDLQAGDQLPFPDGAAVSAGSLIAGREPWYQAIVAPCDGELQWKDVVPGVTMRWRKELGSGRSLVIRAGRKRGLSPAAIIYPAEGGAPILLPLVAGTELRYGSPWDETWPLLDAPARGTPWSPEYESRPLERGPVDDRNFLSPAVPVCKGMAIGVVPVSPHARSDLAGTLPDLVNLLEVRSSGRKGVLAEVDGRLEVTEGEEGRLVLRVVPESGDPHQVQATVLPRGQCLLARDGTLVSVGEPLSDGAVDWNALLKLLGPAEAMSRLAATITRHCRQQGVDLSAKHVEIIVRRLLVDAGAMGESEAEARGTTKPAGGPQPEFKFVGATQAAVGSRSFMARAASQDSVSGLVDAVTSGEVDHLEGLMENVMVGRLIPAGTGVFSDVDLDFGGDDE